MRISDWSSDVCSSDLAALLDAAGQLAGFWLRERNTGVPNCFPFRVRSVKLYAPPPPAGLRLRCDGAITMRGETQLDARWDISDSDGHLLMRAEGWEDRVFTATERFFALRLDPARARLSTPALEGHLPAERKSTRLNSSH